MSRVFITLLIVSVVYAKLCSGQIAIFCMINSELRRCGKLCEPTCERPQERCCKPVDPSACKLECRCKATYVRNTKTGACVKPEQCPCRTESD